MMLDSEAAALLKQAATYLREVLAVEAELRPLKPSAELPYHLQDAYAWAQFDLLGHHCVVFTPKDADKFPLAEVRRHVDQIAKLESNALPVLLLPVLSSFQRRHLIEQHVAFIVPGNQLYLPQLALDLREYFRQRRSTTAGETLSPSTQALLICALLSHPWQEAWRAGDDAERMGYTAMTVSRAMRELQAAGLVSVEVTGRIRQVRFTKPPGETWQSAQPLLKSPVRRVVWVDRQCTPPPDALPAGASALAARSMLADPPAPVWAVSVAGWRQAQTGGALPLPESAPGSMAWQIWRYGPRLLPQGSGQKDSVDPLSLIMSLSEDRDERVQLALDELRESLSWPLAPG